MLTIGRATVHRARTFRGYAGGQPPSKDGGRPLYTPYSLVYESAHSAPKDLRLRCKAAEHIVHDQGRIVAGVVQARQTKARFQRTQQ